MRKKQYFNRQRQPRMQRTNHEQQPSRRLRIRRLHNGVHIPNQKRAAHSESHAHKNPVQNRDGRSRRDRDGDPDEVRVAVQTQALQQVRTLAPVPPQHHPQQARDDEGVAVHQPCRTGEETKVIGVGFVVETGKV